MRGNSPHLSTVGKTLQVCVYIQSRLPDSCQLFLLKRGYFQIKLNQSNWFFYMILQILINMNNNKITKYLQ